MMPWLGSCVLTTSTGWERETRTQGWIIKHSVAQKRLSEGCFAEKLLVFMSYCNVQPPDTADTDEAENQ